MSSDVYQPCPCGSGKKLKFCCHRIAGEMERITKLYENNQRRMALSALEDLQKDHPENRWILSIQASILVDEERESEALAVLETLLRLEPDHAFGLVLYASVRYMVEGYQRAKAAIQRAFQKCARSQPILLGELALNIAAGMGARRHPMARREYLTFAMRLASNEDDQHNLFLALLQHDGDERIPFPLRSIQALSEPTVSSDGEEEVRTATKLSAAGCWDAAARLYRKLAEAHPDNADLWHNAGLCHAWDADEARAAEALHRAASLRTDFENAVETETLAQFLDVLSGDAAVPFASRKFPVRSISKLLSLLDEHEQFNRDHQEAKPAGASGADFEPVGEYSILDRPPVKYSPGAEIAGETLPLQIARLAIFDRIEETEEPPIAFLFAAAGETFEKSVALLTAASGDEIGEPEPEERHEEAEPMPRFLEPLLHPYHFPSEMPLVVVKRIHRERIEQFVNETWSQNSLAALNGRCPDEVIGDGECRVPLAAAINLLEAYCCQVGVSFDTTAVRQRFGLDPLQTIEVDEDASLSNLSALQIRRLPVESLVDKQLMRTLNRAMLVHHPDFLYRVLKEVAARPACLEQTDGVKVIQQLAQICHVQNRCDEALEWVDRGRNLPNQEGDAFQRELFWDLRELVIRLDKPHETHVDELVKRLWNYYGSKVPELRERLRELLATGGLEPPRESETIVTPGEGGGPSGESELWVPDAATGSTPQSGDKKLWLPGQD